MKKSSGFTLIEVLIATAIMVSLIGVATLSFSLFSNGWSKQQNKFNRVFEQQKLAYLTFQAIENISNYLISNDSESEYVFLGDGKSMLFVTHSPVSTRSAMALVKLEVETNGHEEVLIYKEYAFTEKIYHRAGMEFDFNFKLEVSSASSIRFNYFGWENYGDKVEFIEGEGNSPAWLKQFDAATARMLPLAINIIFDEDEPVIFPVLHDNGLSMSYTKESREGG